MNELDKARLALIPSLSEKAPAGHIGRTALMKYLYFLQIIRGVPLGYTFSMYSYGPFESEVLSDLSLAESLKAVEVSPVQFSGGYGYRIKPGIQADSVKRNAAQFLAEYSDDIEWVLATFGKFNSAELELASTIVYVDREFADQKTLTAVGDVTIRVHEIKSHFSVDQIRGFVEFLRSAGILKSIIRESAASY